VRLADGRPVVLSHDCIPVALLGRQDPLALEGSLYAALERAGHRVAGAVARLLPVLASAQAALHLQVAEGAPLLEVDQADHDASGRTVMLSRELHVADAFELWVRRRA
jgi:GntR family transcriptional regulator